MAGNAPVVLVVSKPGKQEAYWVPIKDYFADPVKRQSRKILFNKQSNRFDTNTFADLARVAQPLSEGLYLTARPVTERVFTNFLEVSSYGSRIYIGQTNYRKSKDLGDALKEYVGFVERDFVLWEGKILSFNNLPGFTR